MEAGAALWKRTWQLLKTLDLHLPRDLAIAHLSVCPGKQKRMFTPEPVWACS